MDPNLQNMSAEQIMEMQKKNCIFCKIIAKEIPTHIVHEDDHVMVILDINPASEGHCLVLPKQHYQILPQIPADLIGKLFVSAKRTSQMQLKSLHAKGTSIFVANGALAGQKAPHFMIHVIPRTSHDDLFELPKLTVEADKLVEIKNKMLGVKSETKTITPTKPKESQDSGQAAQVQKPDISKAKDAVSAELKDTKNHPEKKESKPINIDDIARMFT